MHSKKWKLLVSKSPMRFLSQHFGAKLKNKMRVQCFIGITVLASYLSKTVSIISLGECQSNKQDGALTSMKSKNLLFKLSSNDDKCVIRVSRISTMARKFDSTKYVLSINRLEKSVKQVRECYKYEWKTATDPFFPFSPKKFSGCLPALVRSPCAPTSPCASTLSLLSYALLALLREEISTL